MTTSTRARAGAHTRKLTPSGPTLAPSERRQAPAASGRGRGEAAASRRVSAEEDTSLLEGARGVPARAVRLLRPLLALFQHFDEDVQRLHDDRHATVRHLLEDH